VISKPQQREGLDPTRGCPAMQKNGNFCVKINVKGEQKLLIISNILKINFSL
jgi:hypothetical protein